MHGNVFIYDDVRLIGDTMSNNQSYLAIGDVTDSSTQQFRPYRITSYKDNTVPTELDSLFWELNQWGFNLTNYYDEHGSDTTVKLRNGYIYARDSIKVDSIIGDYWDSLTVKNKIGVMGSIDTLNSYINNTNDTFGVLYGGYASLDSLYISEGKHLNKIGSYGNGITNRTGDSIYSYLDTIGLGIYDYKTQGLNAYFGINRISMYDTATGGRFFLATDDSLLFGVINAGSPLVMTATNFRVGNTLNNYTFNYSSHIWKSNNKSLQWYNGSLTGIDNTLIDTIAIDTAVIRSIVAEKIKVKTIDPDTIYSLSKTYLKSPELYIPYGSSFHIGDWTNNLDSVEISIGKDSLTVMDYQISVRDSFNRIALMKSDVFYVRDGPLGWFQHFWAYKLQSIKENGDYWYKVDTLDFRWKANTFSFRSKTDTTQIVKFTGDVVSISDGLDSLKYDGDGNLYLNGYAEIQDSIITSKIVGDGLNIGSGETLNKIIKIGTHAGIILGSDTFWLSKDTL